MKSSNHRQTAINKFHRYRYMTPEELASVSRMSTATAWRTLNDLRARGFLAKDKRRFSLKREPLYYAPVYDSPSAEDPQQEKQHAR